MIEQFDAEIDVLPSGRIHVSETIRFRFTGSWNGVFRDIPVRYETLQGFNYHLDLRVSSVLDEAGQPLEYEESLQGQYKRVKIWVPGATDEARTVNIEYSVENALRFIDPEDSDFEAGYDELYWNVTGLQARVYTGPVGSSTASDTTSTEIEYRYYFMTTEMLAVR